MNRTILPLLALPVLCLLAATPATPTAKQPPKPSSQPAQISSNPPTNQVLTLDLGNRVKMEFVLIPAGEFMMGSPEAEKERHKIENPTHSVRIVQPFYMGKYEVTNQQYRCFKPNHDALKYKTQTFDEEQQPALFVSWEDAQDFCNWVSKKTGRLLSLPSEAEWEYAARGGDRRAYPWGNTWPPPKGAGNFADVSMNKMYPELKFIEGYDDGFPVTSPVGRFKPNSFGLHDLAGNVWEWCQDTFHENYNGAPTDGSAWEGPGIYRIIRGGSWNNYLDCFRCVERQCAIQYERTGYLGFRLTIPGPQGQTPRSAYVCSNNLRNDLPQSERLDSSQPLPRAFPQPWISPTSQPRPSERLQGNEWIYRYEKALAELESLGNGDDGRPALGVLIKEIEPGSQADKLGIRAGDCLASIDGQPIFGLTDYSRYRLDRRQQFKLWSNAGGYRTVETNGGKLGCYADSWWLPGVAYLRSKDRNPAWDDLLRVAGEYWQKNEDLAETALYHAGQAGYQGWVTPAIMTCLTQAHGRSSEALAWGPLALAAAPEEYRHPVRHAFGLAALMNGRIDLAAEIDRQQPEHRIFPDSFDPELALRQFGSLTAEQKSLPAPCLAAARLQGDSPQPRGLNPYGNILAKWYRDHGQFSFKYPLGEMVWGIIGPSAKNLGVSFEYQLSPPVAPSKSSPSDSRSETKLTFMLNNLAEGSEKYLVTVHIIYPDVIWLVTSNGNEMKFVSNRLYGRGWNRLEMAILGPWCEVRMNGRRVYLGTVPDSPDRMLGLGIVIRSGEGTVRRLAIRNFGDDPTASKPAISTPSLVSAPPSPLIIPPPPENPRMAWYHQATVEGYVTSGRRNPVWDAAAVNALAKNVFVVQGNLAQIGEVWTESRKAVEAGCDDPLVLSAYGLAKFLMEGDGPGSLRLRSQAAENIRDSAYSPVVRAIIMMQAAHDAFATHLENNKVRGIAWAREVRDQLPQILQDTKCPNKFLFDVCKVVVTGISPPKDQPTAALDRVCDLIDQARPGSVLIPALKAHFYIEAAWNARGRGWARDVKEDGWKLFADNLQIAAEACQEAWKRDPTDSAAPTMMLSVALGNKAAQQAGDEWLDRAFITEPNNYEACQLKLWSLRPRWGGDEKQMVAFGRECFTRAKEQGLDPNMLMVLVWAHDGYAEDIGIGAGSDLSKDQAQDAYWHNSKVWKDMQEVYGEILRRYPDSTYYQSSYAFHACKCGHWGWAHNIFKKLGNSTAIGPFGSREEMNKMRAQAEREYKAGPKQ